MSGQRKFYLDKANGKWMGVCAGIANYLNVDATFVRVAAVLVTIVGAFPWTVIAYLAAGFLAKSKHHGWNELDRHGSGRLSTHALRGEMRDIDRRLAEVDSYVAHANVRLAREIDELR